MARRFSVVVALAARVAVEAESSPVDCFRLLLFRFLGEGAAGAMLPGCRCIAAAPVCAVVATPALRLLVGFTRPLPFLVEAEGENRSGGMLWALGELPVAVDVVVVAEAALRDAGALEA